MLRYSLISALVILFAQGNKPTVYEPDTFISLPGTQLFFAEAYGDVHITWGAGKIDPIVKPAKTAPVEKVSTDPKRFNSLEGLARILKNNPLKLEVGCHTDAAESPAINEKLSYGRANAIKKKLVALGVDSSQVRVIGYGGTMVDKWYTKTPTKSNFRRVELRITGRSDKPEFSFSDTSLLPLQKRSILFVFDFPKSTPAVKANIDASNARNIDSIVGFMQKNPSVNIMLVKYSDQRGNSDFNVVLCAKRAQTLAKLIIDRGISANRISVFAAGEWNPVYEYRDIKKTVAKEEQNRMYLDNQRVEIIIHQPVILK